VPLAARYLAWLAGHTEYALPPIEAEVAAHATGQTVAIPQRTSRRGRARHQPAG
jgi:hypothetical protein